jgi:histidine ammonia-lyase
VAVTDNPLWIGGRLRVGGNLHGAPLSLALDGARAALVPVLAISERRVYRLTHGGLSGLPSFLVRDSGLRSGLMLAQYTAASLVSEAKGLAFPSAVDSIPTAQHLEDHTPFAARSARATLELVDIAADVVAIELLCAAAALDLRGGPISPGAAQTYEAVRAIAPVSDRDDVLHDALTGLGAAVRAGRFA